MKQTHRIKLRDRTLENDIKYSGPLTYRYLRILGWLFLIIVQIGTVTKLNTRLVPGSVDQIGWIVDTADFFSALPLPLFLLANFAIIFQKKGGTWKNLLIFYGGVALLLYAVGNIVVIHYVYGFVNAFGHIDFQFLAQIIGVAFFSMGNSGLVFNIFIDLFLCSLLYFFLNYEPKAKCFKDKKIYLFRALAILPIAYEIVSIVIKYQCAVGNILIPFYFFFLLTSKPPLMFVAFLALVIILKLEELRVRKHNPDKEFIKEHRKTNAHSLRFSITIAIVFFVAGLVDLFVYLGISVFETARLSGTEASQEAIAEAVKEAINIATLMGFGKAVVLMLVAPLALLFSYTKKHKNPKADILVPVIGIALMLFVYLEGMFQIVTQNIPNVIQKIQDIINNL